MRHVHLLSWAVAFVAVASIVGCGGGASGPELAPVTGKVVAGGQPLAGATVTFVPDNAKDTTGPASSGITNDAGEFNLAAPPDRVGAVVGWHKVTVVTPEAYEEIGSSAEGEGGSGGGGPAVQVADEFADATTTPLSAEVKAEGNDGIELEVTTK
jgi:hypothetical protein